MTFDAGLRIREGGQIKAAGKVDPSGPAVESEVQVVDLGLTAFQPYINPAAAIDLKSGTFSTQGRLLHGVKAAGAQTAYQGGFKLDNLRVTETGGKETLVGWKAVQTDQLTVQLEPNRFEIGDLRVTQPNGKFVIEKDRSLNVAKVIKSEPAPKKPDQAAAPGEDRFPYRVRRVLVSDGKVDFADLSLITPFGTKIHELKGVVAGVASTRGARAQVKLDGRVDDYGTAKIDGELNTSDPKAYTNISVVFRNVELSRLTPYSGKFAGRKIDSGKLSVDLKYKIDKSQLAGDNQVVVERLALGEKVQSPDAVDLPLDLAVALLEDSNGVIDLGLPVSGNLDAPEFSYGALIWKAFVNLLTKIVTSPFRALGALLPGGGEEAFNAVAFDAGRPEVPPPEKEKLAKLAAALQKRPQLKLSVQGRFNPETDRAELKSAAVRRAVATRLGQKPGPGEDPGPVDFSSPETGKSLEALYSERFGAEALKPLKAEEKAALEKSKKDAAAAKTAGGAPEAAAEDTGRFAKNLFARLTEAEPIDDAALAKLAEARAQAIVIELSEAGQIPAERIDVQPPAAVDKQDPASAALNLQAGRSSS
jgi:outer membrane protein OmpA-like peptidoglycan-associated protein